ncbi:hypothetical protein LTR84_006924 [Exophiala bonariae]|uniref:ABM domain-containing protein n=1 Tax=Exophiala bonariae TaxID=1690606 RepID=A0AAV9MZH5_9EURO|nr:hypothetical protein LTR84_006924 [Exophiala bonariae]
MDRLIELLTETAQRIEASEHDITRFSITREVDKKTTEPTNTLVLIETYKSRATFERHFQAPQYAEFQEVLKREDIIDFSDPNEAEIRTVRYVSGHW